MCGFLGSDFDGTTTVSMEPTHGKETVLPSVSNLVAFAAIRARVSRGIQSTPASKISLRTGFGTSETAAVTDDTRVGDTFCTFQP